MRNALPPKALPPRIIVARAVALLPYLSGSFDTGTLTFMPDSPYFFNKDPPPASYH